MKSPLRILLALVLAGPPLAAQETRPDLTALPVARLLENLSSVDFSLRRRSSDELARRGAAVIPALEAARKGAKLEARLRIEQILDRLAAREADHQTNLSASLVTLAIQERPLDELLQALGAQAGMRLELAPLRPGNRTTPPGSSEQPRVASLEATRRPFWQVLDRLCQQQELVFRRDARNGRLLLTSGPPARGPTVYSGPFRVGVSRFSVTRQYVASGDTVVSAYLQLQIDIEDRASVLGVLTPLVARLAEDDKGRSLLPPSPPENFYLSQPGTRRQVHLALTLTPPERDAVKLKKLVCPLRFVVPSEMVATRLQAPFAKDQVSNRRTPLRLSIDRFKLDGGRTEVTLSFETIRPEGSAPTNARVQPRAMLVFRDGTGDRVMPSRTGNRTAGGRQVRVLTLPTTDLREISVQAVQTYETRELLLEFEDIPVP